MKLTHVKSLENDLIFTPNDVVLLDEKLFTSLMTINLKVAL